MPQHVSSLPLERLLRGDSPLREDDIWRSFLNACQESGVNASWTLLSQIPTDNELKQKLARESVQDYALANRNAYKRGRFQSFGIKPKGFSSPGNDER